MAEHHHPMDEPITTGTMDYDEHNRTYGRFLWLVKYGAIAVIAILLGMLAGLVAGWGILMSLAIVIAAFFAFSYAVG